MRVATQNLLAHHMDRPRRLPAAADRFRRLDPDAALRETVATGDYDQATEMLGEGFHVTHHPLSEPGGTGDFAARVPR